MSEIKNTEERQKILSALKNEKIRIWKESEHDTAWLEYKTKMTINGFIEKATRHIESGGKIYSEVLESQELAYKWGDFKIKGVNVLFKVVFKNIEGLEKLAIISCKHIKK